MSTEHSEHSTRRYKLNKGASGAAQGTKGIARVLLPFFTRRLNPLMATFAGRQGVTFFAELHHRGRWSGRWYTTPVAARRTANGFVIALTFGQQADWVKNVRAANGCNIRWNGVDYELVQPEVVGLTPVRVAFGPVERVLLAMMGVGEFVRLQVADNSSSARFGDHGADAVGA
jgi:deazaflavin-dependent oxidoreductase (nitroreductase family)